tara:strand:- start:9193 stop:9930 length:738 start_codon:yes stop_codon:yes gene_type:complete
MIKAVILAAGRGSRLGHLTNDRPKGLVELDGKSLLEWQCKALYGCGISEISVVTGYLSHKIERLGFKTIYNDNWENSNMVASIKLALDQIEGPLIFSYSDIVYHPDIVKKLLSEDSSFAIAYDPNWLSLWQQRFENPLSDAETFLIDSNRWITQIGKKSSLYSNMQGQFMGLFKVGITARISIENFLTFNPELINSLDTTTLLSLLLEKGNSLRGVPLDSYWCEIDSLSDLKIAKTLVESGKLKC